MGEVRVPADAKWRAQTQRAVENFPISGQRIERAHIEALARIKGAAAKVNAELGVLDKDIAEAIQEAADEVAEGTWDEHFPVDVFQTGSGHLVQHEHQRGHRHARDRAARPGRPPERPRQRLAVVQRRLPVLDPHRRHRRRHPRPDPRAGAPGRLAGAQGRGVRRRGEVGADPPHGRHARDAGPGVRRVRRAGAVRRRAAARRPSPGSPNCRWAARPSAPASTRRPASPPPSSRRSPAPPGCRSPRPATTSRRRARGTASWRPAGSSGRSPSA